MTSATKLAVADLQAARDEQAATAKSLGAVLRVLRSQARASSACASMVGCLETPLLRSVPRRSLPDRLAVDLRSSLVASYGPPVAPRLRSVSRQLTSAKVVLSWLLEERTPSGSESPPTL
jgi:hypothetical protein